MAGANSRCGASSKPCPVEAPPPWPSPASGRGDAGWETAELLRPSTPGVSRVEPSPACGVRGERSSLSRLGGGASTDVVFEADASRFATSSLVPRVDFRARCAAASPPERRSHELSGGGCNPVEEPRPLSPRLIAGLSNSASAGPIGCTSGLDALEFGVFDFGAFAGFFGVSGFFAMAGIWDESAGEKRAKAFQGATPGTVAFHCQQVSALAFGADHRRHFEGATKRRRLRHSGMVR